MPVIPSFMGGIGRIVFQVNRAKTQDPIQKITKVKGVKCLPSKYKALSSNSILH
jgi:hypothetical protein